MSDNISPDDGKRTGIGAWDPYNHRSENRTWEMVDEREYRSGDNEVYQRLSRMSVPGGWLYEMRVEVAEVARAVCVTSSMCFVPLCTLAADRVTAPTGAGGER